MEKNLRHLIQKKKIKYICILPSYLSSYHIILKAKYLDLLRICNHWKKKKLKKLSSFDVQSYHNHF